MSSNSSSLEGPRRPSRSSVSTPLTRSRVSSGAPPWRPAPASSHARVGQLVVAPAAPRRARPPSRRRPRRAASGGPGSARRARRGRRSARSRAPRVVRLDAQVVDADQAAQPVGDLALTTVRVERRRGSVSVMRISSRWPSSWRSRRSDWARSCSVGVGVDHGLRGHRGVDLEVAQVVAAELVEPQLGQHDDADDPVVVAHRRQQHRLVEVLLGPRDRGRARVGERIGQVLRRRRAPRPSR